MKWCLCLIVTLLPITAAAQERPRDEYARYELLGPGSGSIRIVSDVTIATPNAKTYALPPGGGGAQVSDVTAIDLMSGEPLRFTQQGGTIRVELARPVPAGGESRIRVTRVEKDAVSYRAGDPIAFNRAVSARRGAVVLPKGFELTSADVPVQVLEDPDGRIVASFMNPYPGAAPLAIKARPIAARPQAAASPSSPPPTPPMADPPQREQALNQIRVSERAAQDREIVYFLKEPETHAFALYHDYTAMREGERQYVNVVRTGSTVSDPSAKVLDTGEALPTRTLTGADIAREKIDIPDRVPPDTQVVLIPFPPVKKGTSLRLRISETYTDPARYALVDGQLMWHRGFGRPRNDMVLPAGWYLTTSSIPAVISQETDGRIRLSFWNPRPDNIDVVVRGRRR